MTSFSIGYVRIRVLSRNAVGTLTLNADLLLQELLLDELVARSATGMLQEGRKTLLYKDVGAQYIPHTLMDGSGEVTEHDPILVAQTTPCPPGCACWV